MSYNAIRDKFKINHIKQGDISAFSPNKLYRKGTIEDICSRVVFASKYSRKKFFYCYCNEPDYTLHYKGTTSPEASTLLRRINDGLSSIKRKINKRTAVIVIADHGQVDKDKCINFSKFPDFKDCLSAPATIESTAISFRIKDARHEEFKTLFNKYIDGFQLMSCEEVIANRLFGIGENHVRLEECIGDYLAIAIGKCSIWR